MRVAPEGAVMVFWDLFEKWADDNGVGTDSDDWEPWWECFKSGAYALMELNGENEPNDDN